MSHFFLSRVFKVTKIDTDGDKCMYVSVQKNAWGKTTPCGNNDELRNQNEE